MTDYVTNKVLSIGSVFAIVLGSYALFGDGSSQWQMVLIALIVTGYTHFLLGAYYQLRGFHRRPDRIRQYLVFAVLTLLAYIMTFGFFFFLDPFLAVFLSVVYFLVHGLFNEQTQLEKQTGIQLPLVMIAPIMIAGCALVLGGMLHPSSVISSNMVYSATFAESNPFAAATHFDILTVIYGTILAVTVSFVIALYAWWRHGYTWYSLGLLVFLAVVAAIIYSKGPLPYINVVFLIIGYHFVTWFLYFFVNMYRRHDGSLTTYVLLHSAIVVPLVCLGVLVMQGVTDPFVTNWFRFDVFVFFSTMHITTSFMNDAWLQRWIAFLPSFSRV